jgi:fermentation-respiration switch protein FrsA (DUF1100 family)
MTPSTWRRVFLTQPLQIVAGSMVGSEWMNDDLYKRAASTNKDFHVVEANHMSFYDIPQWHLARASGP